MKDVANRIIQSSIREGLIKDASNLSIVDQRDFRKKAEEMSGLLEKKFPDIEFLEDNKVILIFRYFMGKAAETCISDELYSSKKDRFCNITYIFDDVDKEYFTINIPAHYSFELSDLSMHYLRPLKNDIEYIRNNGNTIESFSSAIIQWQLIAYTNAYLREAYKVHGQFKNESIKTLDEVMICAIRGVFDQLNLKGWEIEEMNISLLNPWNIKARYKNRKYALLLRTNYGLNNANIRKSEITKLAKYCDEYDYSVGYVLVDLRSTIESHKKSQVILIGDKMNFRITSFQLFEKKDK